MMTTHAQPPTASVPPLDPTVLGEYGATGSLRLLTWPALAASGADAAVTARAGGVSSGPYATLNLSLSVGDDPGRVLENRRRLAAAFGAGPGDFVFARQVHGANVRGVGEAERGSGAFALDNAIPDVDALVTRTPGLVLAILTADCVPIVLHDPVAGVLACVHAGWRGTVARVAAAAVAAMQTLGARPRDVIAGIGPAMGPRPLTRSAPTSTYAVGRGLGPAVSAVMRPDRVAGSTGSTCGAGDRTRPRHRQASPAPRIGTPGGGCPDLWAANRYVPRRRRPRCPDPRRRHPHRPRPWPVLQRPHRAPLRPPRPGRPAAPSGDERVDDCTRTTLDVAATIPRGRVFRYESWHGWTPNGVC